MLFGLPAIAIIAAVFAPRLGLGVAEDFLLYRIVGIPRRELVISAICVLFGAPVVWWTFRVLRRNPVPFCVALFSTALSLLFLEGALRLVDGIPVTTNENFVARGVSFAKTDAFTIYDPQLGWVPMPDKSGPNRPLTTGAYGTRMPSSVIAPLKQHAILMVGDSFGLGSEVADAETWPAQLQALIEKDVINAGVAGYGLDQIVLRSEILVPMLLPETLLVEMRMGYGVSVVRLATANGAPKPYFLIENGKLVLHNSPVPPFTEKSADIGTLRAVLGHSYLVQFIMTRLNLLQWWMTVGSTIVNSDSDALEISCVLIKRLGQLRDRYHAKIVFVLQYSGDEPLGIYHDPQGAAFIGCIYREGFQIVDVMSALRKFYEKEGLGRYRKLWNMLENDRVYGHMSAAGNRLIAQIIAAEVFGRSATEESYSP
jgi:hypothetical protein